jgi:hypothetical protein
VAAQLVASRAVLSSTELVTCTYVHGSDEHNTVHNTSKRMRACTHLPVCTYSYIYISDHLSTGETLVIKNTVHTSRKTLSVVLKDMIVL